MKQPYLYPGNEPPWPKVCNKGDPSMWIKAGGNSTQLLPIKKYTIKSCFLASFNVMSDVRNINCPKK